MNVDRLGRIDSTFYIIHCVLIKIASLRSQ
jgi:hypothetical protein